MLLFHFAGVRGPAFYQAERVAQLCQCSGRRRYSKPRPRGRQTSAVWEAFMFCELPGTGSVSCLAGWELMGSCKWQHDSEAAEGETCRSTSPLGLEMVLPEPQREGRIAGGRWASAPTNILASVKRLQRSQEVSWFKSCSLTWEAGTQTLFSAQWQKNKLTIIHVILH